MAKECKDCVVKIFGACRGEFCLPERRGLEEQAQREALARGHTVSTFEKVAGQPVWRGRCERCGMTVAYVLDPEPGESPVSGEALDRSCPEVEPQDVGLRVDAVFR